MAPISCNAATELPSLLMKLFIYDHRSSATHHARDVSTHEGLVESLARPPGLRALLFGTERLTVDGHRFELLSHRIHDRSAFGHGCRVTVGYRALSHEVEWVARGSVRIVGHRFEFVNESGRGWHSE